MPPAVCLQGVEKMRRHAPATLAVILGLTSLLPAPEAHANAGVVLRQAPAVAPQGEARDFTDIATEISLLSFILP